MSTKSAVKKAPIAKKAAFDPHRKYSREEPTQFVKEDIGKRMAEGGPQHSTETVFARAAVTPERTFRVLTAAHGALVYGLLFLDDIQDCLDQRGLAQEMPCEFGHLFFAEGGMKHALDMVETHLKNLQKARD